MVHECVDDNEDLGVRDYRGVLDSYGLPDEESVLAADVSKCDGKCTHDCHHRSQRQVLRRLAAPLPGQRNDAQVDEEAQGNRR